MLRTKVTTWLLLLFAFLLRPSKCLASTCQETDHPNLDHAMVGFDPFLANAYEQFDPGFRSRIFEPTGEVFDSKFNTYSLPNEFSNYLSCALQFTSTVLSNFSDYEIDKERRFFPRQEANDDKNHSLNEADVRDVSSGDLEEGTEEKIIREFYLETNGEIVQSKITCIAQELRVPSFSRPAFTAAFSAALQTLQLAAKNSETEYSKKIYREFVDMYGTHYMKKSKMGAEIIFQKLFTTKEKDDKTKHARQNCINSCTQRSIANDTISFEAVIADLSEITEDCDYSSGGREYFSNSGIKSSRVIINGPPPIGTVEQWSTAVKQSPVPVRFQLEKIHALFLRNSIESSLTRADGESLCEATSGILLYNLFESMYSSYCAQMGGRHCSPEIVNFGANSGCPPGSTCNKVSGHSDILKDAYECTPDLVETTTLGDTAPLVEATTLVETTTPCDPAPLVETTPRVETTTPGDPAPLVLTTPRVETTTLVDTTASPFVDTTASPLVDIGGVIVTGGADGSILSDVETINARRLPNLPQAVRSHSLSQVGSSLYSCGGSRDSGTTDACHTLDLSSRPPVWESSPNLPKTMFGHGAVTIGSHIWFTHSNKLYDFRTDEQLFRTYSLPMAVTSYHCAVSNNTHSYIIGAGADNTEVWINKYSSSPEEWVMVAHLSSGRRYHGCLWFNDIVLIAGGYRGGRISDVEMLNTETNTVTVTGPLLHGRVHLGMFVLDGEPAVVGGYDDNKHLDTIETFDVSTNTWKLNDRKLVTARSYFGLVQLH